jgi:hypothetical protein
VLICTLLSKFTEVLKVISLANPRVSFVARFDFFTGRQIYAFFSHMFFMTVLGELAVAKLMMAAD